MNNLIRRILFLSALLFGLLGYETPLAQAQSGFYTEDVTPTAGDSFTQPTALAFAPDGRLFVAEKGGAVYVIDDDEKQEQPFVDLEAEVLNDHDRGLLGLALDPNFASNHYVYLLYTVDVGAPSDGEAPHDAFGRLVRYTASGDDPTVAEARKVLIGETFSEGIPACSQSHAPGALRFSADGTLLISTGDAASFSGVDLGGQHPSCFGPEKIDEEENVGALRAQRLTSLAGKILRIDPATGEGVPSNPHYTGNPADAQSRVWEYGLRNPFRFAIRPGSGSSQPQDGQPGALYIGDVGWNTWEELNVASSSDQNYGWPCYEGPAPQVQYQEAIASQGELESCPAFGDVHAPAWYWNHGEASSSQPPGLQGQTITSGAFYPGTTYPAAYQDRLFYGDFLQGWLAAAEVDPGTGSLEAQSVLSPDDSLGQGVVDIRYDPASDYLYLADLMAGEVMRLRHENEGDESGEAPFEVTSFTLINADTDEDLRPLEDGDEIALDALPTQNLNVRANAEGEGVNSVVFALDDEEAYRTESVAPYALAANDKGDYFAWTPSVGEHTLTAIPYAEDKGAGRQGPVRSIRFTVSGGGKDTTPPTITTKEPTTLWPPDQRYATLGLSDMIASVDDDAAGDLSVEDARIVLVGSNEPEDGPDDGQTLDDIVIAPNARSVKLRRERQRSGNGRVYLVVLAASDPSANTGLGFYYVRVPKRRTERKQKRARASARSSPVYESVDARPPVYTVEGKAPPGVVAKATAAVRSRSESASARLPTTSALQGNYPNPFRQTTTIAFELAEQAPVQLVVYDLLGREVAALINRGLPAGTHRVAWDGTGADGQRLPSGIYLYRLEAGSFTGEGTMTLVR